MRIKLNDDLLLKMIFLFPITVLIQRYNNVPNRILFATIILLLLNRLIVIIFKEKKSKQYKVIYAFIILIFLMIYDFYKTGENLINFNDIMYLPFWIVFLNYCVLNYEKLEVKINEYLPMMKKSFVFGVLLIILFFVYEKTAYFTNGRHRMASGAFLLLVEIVYYCIKTKKRKNYVYAIIPLIAILGSTSRTYVIMSILLIVYAYWTELKNKVYFYFTIIPIGIIIGIIIMKSSIWEYFQFKQVGEFDYWGSITSGRTVFWEADIKAYRNSNIVNKIFGNGYNLVYSVNSKAIDAIIYAHNDFINILLANGIIGIIYYLTSLFKFAKSILKNKKINFSMSMVVFIIFIFNAFFNGQYNYPAATFAMLFLFDIAKSRKEV